MTCRRPDRDETENDDEDECRLARAHECSAISRAGQIRAAMVNAIQSSKACAKSLAASVMTCLAKGAAAVRKNLNQCAWKRSTEPGTLLPPDYNCAVVVIRIRAQRCRRNKQQMGREPCHRDLSLL